jgi:dTDP-glucose 4,6-dehydratase
MLVTGGCGFIGTAFVRWELANDPAVQIVNLDALRHGGMRSNLSDCEADFPGRYEFVHGDICDSALLRDVFAKHQFDTVVHLAAESHVDRSIDDPTPFVRTNVLGTMELLEAARKAWSPGLQGRFHHVSTDEVFGSARDGERFGSATPYDPSSPYSASKAGADHLVRAWARTYGLPVTISNCSNNYGPYQFPEKLLPLIICRAMQGKRLPVYGDGMHEREWLFVTDHVLALDSIIRNGTNARSYFVGSGESCANIDLVRRVLALLDEIRPGPTPYADQIEFVSDRPGHDRRYVIDASDLSRELSWAPKTRLAEGLRQTVEWYANNAHWVAAATMAPNALDRVGVMK